MMILRFCCPQHVRHVISTAATTQTRPNFILHLRRFILLTIWARTSASRARRNWRIASGWTGEVPRYLDNRPISKLKNFAESTSRATLALGTNLSRNTGDVLTLTSVGADPRIDMFMAAVCFSISERRRKSPALGL